MKVWIVPEYPESLMTGGLQVQAVESCRALNRIEGVTGELFNWSEKRPLPDLVHFMGMPEHMKAIAGLVRRARVPYTVTLLMGGRPTRKSMFAAAVRARSNGFLRCGSSMTSVLRGASRVIAITEGDKRAAEVVFGLESKKVAVIPHGIGRTFFEASPEPWRKSFGDSPFILFVGSVQRRKNPLLLLDAANELRIPVVLLGPVLPGETAYAAKVAEALEINHRYGGRWLQNLTNDDELLRSAYAACRGFALLSSSETQPLSVMQAMAARKPIVLLEAPYVADELFKGLPRIADTSPKNVADGLGRLWESAESTSLPETYSWDGVALQLATIYRSVLGLGAQ